MVGRVWGGGCGVAMWVAKRGGGLLGEEGQRTVAGGVEGGGFEDEDGDVDASEVLVTAEMEVQ